MQNCPFRQKINKQHNVVLKQLTRFRNGWQGKIIDPQKVQTYCNMAVHLSQVHSNYAQNFMEYFTPVMKQEMIQLNKTIIEDLVTKVRYFAQQSKKSSNSFTREKKQLCQLCSSKIRQVDVRIIKQHLSDDASLRRNLLRKLYADLQNQNADLFSKDEDEVFFKFLNRILVKKEELLAMQTKQINGFLLQVTKSFGDMNFLTDYTPVKYSPGDYKENYKDELSKTITHSLKDGFDQKVHPWIEKVFEAVKKQILTQKRLGNQQKACQVDDEFQLIKKRSQYLIAGENKRQLQSLKQQINQNTIIIADLRNKLSVLQRQKRELEEYYAKEVESLLMQKRQVEVKLRKTETDFYSLKQINQEITLQNKRLRREKRGTQVSETKTNKSQKSLTEKSSNNGDVQEKRQGQDKNRVSRKKKRGPMNKLLSRTSLLTHNTFSGDSKPLAPQRDQIQQDQNEEIVMKKTISEVVDNNISLVMEKGQSVVEAKKQKKSLKNLDRPLSRKEKSPDAQQHKVQFKLQESPSTKDIPKLKKTSVKNMKQNISKKEDKFQINNPNGQLNQTSIETNKNIKLDKKEKEEQQGINATPKLIKKKSSFSMGKNASSLIRIEKSEPKPKQKPTKRMVSIEMSTPPIFKPISPESHSQQRSRLQTTIEQDEQVLSTLGEQKFKPFKQKSPQSEKKNIFQFVPIEDKKEYEELREKILEVASRIESKNSERLKTSIKNLFDRQAFKKPETQFGKVYGFSIFNNQRDHKPQSGENSVLHNNTMDMSRNGYIELQRDSINQNENLQDEEDNLTNRKSKGIQTSFKDIKMNSASCLLDHVSVDKRAALYEQMKNQASIPKILTYDHYEMIVRRLFGDLNKQMNETLPKNIYTKTPQLPINEQTNRLKQYQSVKINIDSKFLDESRMDKIHQQKVILNLPRLDKIPYNRMPHLLTKGQLNLNTVREKINVCKDVQNNITSVKISPEKEDSTTPIQEVLKDSQSTPSLLKPLNKTKHNEWFGQKDLSIFFDSELAAFQYQQKSKYNFKHDDKQHRRLGHKLSGKQNQQIQSLYSILLYIKSRNHQVYYKVCSFLKHPYQTVKHGFQFINIGKDMLFESWRRYLLRLYGLRYNKDQAISFGDFIKPFEEKLIQLVVMVNK